MSRVLTGPALQARWDSEAATIERGSRSFYPDDLASEPSMLTGATFTIAMLALLFAGFQVVEWILT